MLMATMLSRLLVRILLGALVVVLVILGWFALQIDPIFAGKGKEVTITVQAGDSFSSVASELHAKGVIASPFALRLEGLVLGAPVIGAGTYEFRQGSSFASVRSILGNGPNVFVVSPGLTLHEVAVNVADIEGSSFGNTFATDATAAVTPSTYGQGSSLEGLIGDGNYLLSPSLTPAELVNEMVTRFEKKAAKLGLTPSTTINGLDAYQLVTAASIVEKEGYYPRNMPKVARVIFNRLARGGPLQMDATVLYYYGQDGGTVTPAMLQTVTPYNSYLNNGLTPTPICTASNYSLNAVLHAPAGTWLYFTVVNQHGDEAFSTTFAQQLQNEKLGESRGIK
jgi:UPF0755 protein